MNHLVKERDNLLREEEGWMQRKRAREKEQQMVMLGKLKAEGLHRCVFVHVQGVCLCA